MAETLSSPKRKYKPFSILIEWENVLLSGNSRANIMLSRVIEQANKIEECIELIISANTHQPSLLHRPRNLQPQINWKLLINPECHYYELKNKAASVAKGEIIIFVDSDVIPDSQWLTNILQGFEDPSVMVSCGKAWIDHDSLYSKAFALFWFFPLKDKIGLIEKPKLQKVNHFFANNVAFNKDLFLKYGFISDEKASRGGCLFLAEKLMEDNIDIIMCEEALVAHPPPQPGAHFVMRALAQGRDKILRSRNFKKNIGFSLYRLVQNSCKASVKIVLRHRHVELPLIQAPAAIVLALTYYALYFIGEVLTLVHFKPIYKISI